MLIGKKDTLKVLLFGIIFLGFFCLPKSLFFLSLICPLNLCQFSSSFCYCSLKLEAACNSSLVLLMKLKQRDGNNNSLTKYLFTPGIFCSLILLQTVLQELHTLISHSTVSPWIDYYWFYSQSTLVSLQSPERLICKSMYCRSQFCKQIWF